MKNKQISEKEINRLFKAYEQRKKQEDFIEKYRSNCFNFNNGLCEGDTSVNCKSGCSLCIKEKKYNLNNAKPSIGTEDFQELEKEKQLIFANALKNCNLSFGKSDFCRYKGLFNYCDFCNKEFKRRER